MGGPFSFIKGSSHLPLPSAKLGFRDEVIGARFWLSLGRYVQMSETGARSEVQITG